MISEETTKFQSNHVLNDNQEMSEISLDINPLQKIFQEDLLPFSETLIPLYCLVVDLKQNAMAAVIFSQKPDLNSFPPGFTKQHAQALNLYTRSCDFHIILNRTLRDKHNRESKLKPWRPYLRLLLSGIACLPRFQGNIWRGIPEYLFDKYKVGQKIFWWSISSCTQNVNILEDEQFLGTKGDRTLFSISCKMGFDIRQFSTFPKEAEILLLPGTYLLVKNTAQFGNGLCLVELVEEYPPLEVIIGFLHQNQNLLGQVSAQNTNPSQGTPSLSQHIGHINQNPSQGTPSLSQQHIVHIDVLESLKLYHELSNQDFSLGEGKIPNKFQSILTSLTIQLFQTTSWVTMKPPNKPLHALHEEMKITFSKHSTLQHKLTAGIEMVFTVWGIDCSMIDIRRFVPEKLYYAAGHSSSPDFISLIISFIEPYANDISMVSYAATYFYVKSLYQQVVEKCKRDMMDPSLEVPNPLFYGIVADFIYELVIPKISKGFKNFAEVIDECDLIFFKNKSAKKLQEEKWKVFRSVPRYLSRNFAQTTKHWKMKF